MAKKKEITPAEKKAADQKAANAAEIKKNGFLNPFSAGVTYEDFLASLPKDTKVDEFLKGKIPAEKIDWLINDLQNLKK